MKMKLHTLILLAALLHSTDGDDRCVFPRVGEKATITCSVTNPDQDGVYVYRWRPEIFCNSTKETMSYYYKDGTFTPETPHKDRLETNRNLRHFSVSISNVSEHDSGVYWCRFNRRDVNTDSELIYLKVQSETEQKCPEKTKSDLLKSGLSFENQIYLCVIGGLLVIILVLVVVLALTCRERGNYAPKQHHTSNGVYEVMRGNTPKALVNPAYESSQRAMHPDVY